MDSISDKASKDKILYGKSWEVFGFPQSQSLLLLLEEASLSNKMSAKLILFIVWSQIFSFAARVD